MTIPIKVRLQELEERHSSVSHTISSLIKDRNALQESIDKLRREIKNSQTIEETAKMQLQGHSIASLRAIWNEYLFVMSKHSIGGLIMLNDLEGAQNSDELFYSMLKEVGGQLLHNAFSHLAEYKIDEDGEKLYPFPLRSRRVYKKERDKFNRRIRRPNVVEAFMPFATVVKVVKDKNELE